MDGEGRYRYVSLPCASHRAFLPGWLARGCDAVRRGLDLPTQRRRQARLESA